MEASFIHSAFIGPLLLDLGNWAENGTAKVLTVTGVTV